MNRKSNPVSEFIEINPFITLLSIAVIVAGITYGVMDKLILAHYKLNIDSQKDRIAKLEKLNKETLMTIDSLLLKLNSNQRDTIINIVPPDNRIASIDNLISTGEKLRKEFKNSDSLKIYLDWRNECISVIGSVESTEELMDKFKNTVNINDGNFTMIPRMIDDGIEILKEIKGKIKP